MTIIGIPKSFNDGYLTLDIGKNSKIRLDKKYELREYRPPRSLEQNAFYWVYLSWCIEQGGLREKGHFSTDALHRDIKSWMKEVHKVDFKIPDNGEFSSRDMNRSDFSNFFDFVDRELMGNFFEIDTSRFWKDYEKMKEGI